MQVTYQIWMYGEKGWYLSEADFSTNPTVYQLEHVAYTIKNGNKTLQIRAYINSKYSPLLSILPKE